MSNQRIWMSQEGPIPVCNMTSKHLRNTIAMIDRRPKSKVGARGKLGQILYALQRFAADLRQIFSPIREELVAELARRDAEVKKGRIAAMWANAKPSIEVIDPAQPFFVDEGDR